MRMEDEAALREALAALCHEQWSGWMAYMLAKCWVDDETGAECIPAQYVKGLRRQMHTAYSDLSAEEKDSDRAEADRILALLREKGVLG